MDNATGNQLNKDDGTGGGLKNEAQSKGNGVANESTKPNGKNLGARPKYLAKNGQSEKHELGSTSFISNRPAFRENRGGHSYSRCGRNLEMPERKVYYNSQRNGRGPFFRKNSGQGASGQPVFCGGEVFDGNTPEVMKGERKFVPEEEGIPGFQLTQIKELLQKDSTQLLMHLSLKLKGLISLLKHDLGPDMIMLVVEMLAKISTSPRKEKQAALLAQAIQPSVLEKFSSHSFDIVAQKQKYSSAELIKYFENLYVLYQDVVNIMPSKASEILSDHSTRAVMAIQNLKAIRNVPVPPKLEKDYEILMTSVESLLEQRKSAAPKKSREKIRREWQPGIDFRQLSIHPLPQDLLSNAEVNIFPVVVDGPYKNVEHYLDVQFNLMREDFLIPLREGIADFIEQRSSKSKKYKRIENVRFYNNVRFLNQFIEGDVIVTEVLFNARAKTSRHNWKRSKRFLYGSLLCFTSDLFSSVVLGVVVDRKVELLEKGILRCELIGDVKEEGLFKKEYIMAENEVYFEAYQHVMRALQNFNDVNFPLREYIINVSSGLHLPTYLANDPYAMYETGEFEFPVLDDDFWPTKEDLKVNESQFRALRSALTKKCAVIQGPPGTGKTYLGLIIAKLLLENSDHWRKVGKGPMLVVCFTNHALDQFLEGMLSFTKNIVRVGGQSKNENLNDYNLRIVRKAKGIKNYDLRDIVDDIEKCAWNINHNNNLLMECMKNVGILAPNYLYYGMEICHRSCFTFNNSWRDSNFLEWLLSGAYFQDLTGTNLAMNDIEPIPENMTHVYALSLIQIKIYICQLQHKARAAEVHEQESIRNIIMMHVSRFHYMKNKLAEPFEPNMELIARLSTVRNLNKLHPEHRWILYKYWVSQAIEYYQGKLMEGRIIYQDLNKKKSVMMEEMYLNTLIDCDVVGMTTTGAARHQSLLQRLGSKIVIVEEAAEAMESHIVACLSSECQHLILIGDHKQLRPSPAVYKLAKDYNLEISLFERMLMNGIKFDTLRIQHRMRPDIADLVFPSVYPLLENHPSVLAYDNVIGLKKNLYFITHAHLEEATMDDLSKKNPHEAKFLIALCRHIILQGYDPSQITILAAYLGQMFLLTEERDKNEDVKDVKIVVVDNFQGEENDIILLSLVRNNEEGRIGFLGSENRTCVALSRAKQGLYIMGNIDMLAEKSRLWCEIRKVLQEKEAVGTHLTLQCLKHPEQLTEVSKAEDFNSVIEGGCKLMCVERLNCGHICNKLCHVQGHDVYKCNEICNKVMCGRDHRCQKLCWDSCGDCMVTVEKNLPCGHTAEVPCHLDPKEYKCMETVSVSLPNCEHTNEKLCFIDLKNAKCSFPCDSRLPCGHICPMNCHVNCDPEHLEFKCMRPCSRKNRECKDEHTCQRLCYEECGTCTVKVNRKLPNCEHYYYMECSVDSLTFKCHKPCKKILDCGHGCPKKCVDICGDCSMIVEKEIPDCKHKMKMKCSKVPVRRMCEEKCTRTRSCGHICTSICGDPCNEKKCKFLSKRTARACCGHDVNLFCVEVHDVPSAQTLAKRCNQACEKILECTHKCKGTCGQCMLGRIHIPCQEKCGRKLVCGHMCTEMCSHASQQCKDNCLFCCEHGRCRSKCGKLCTRCKKKCGWQCEHQTCNRDCFQFCDRPPCDEPCKKKLKCGHECIGFCGEKCPALCRVCNPEAVADVLAFLGGDGDHISRFVLLPDCGHVFELTALDKFLSKNSIVVKMLECPQCEMPIQQAYRYRNAAKNRFNLVMQVKYRLFGNLGQINSKLIHSAKKLWNLTRLDEFQKSRSALGELQKKIGQSKKAHFGAIVLNSLEVRTAFVMAIAEHFHELRSKVNTQVALQDCTKIANSLIKKILSQLDSISVQEHSDYEGECMRFHLMMLLRALESTNGFKNGSKTNWYHDYEKCRVVVEDTKAFPKDKYSETRRQINEVYKKMHSSISIGFRRLLNTSNSQIDLSRSEMRQVDAAIDLHQGRWCECPNGHIFVVSDCAHAMQTRSCNECGAELEGGSLNFF